ncbi:zinc finger, CCHC-type containing protein [Tanacetum coccineum]|uniref:Zinc finger, CCHC-type containing protein n=1 Tax=Tanacetum coccineum TaxID=301880 RepID=A0ABQ5C7K6_9ASTR
MKNDGNNDGSNKKSKLTCWKCGKTGHFKQDYRVKKNNGVNTFGSGQGSKYPNSSQGNKKYVVNFIDFASRFCYVYLCHAKDEALDKFKINKTEVELQQNDLIKTLRTDRGGEYYKPVYFQSVQIMHETTAPYTPQQNGVSEKNRALKEVVNSMLSYLGETTVETPTVRRSNRARVAKSFGSGQLYLVEGSRDEIGSQYSYCYSIEEDPKTFDNAMKSYDLKARLVIQGFRQKEGIDYFDIYALVARIFTIRLLIALAATYNLVIHQMNVKTIFLNVDLEDEDLGDADVIIGIRKHEDKGITITQSHYIEKILKKFKFNDCCPLSTPLDPTIKLMPNRGKAVDQLEYSRAIGFLMYVMTSTRPDIAYAVGSGYQLTKATTLGEAI